MGGACARQFCSAVAVVRIDFDGLARVVWIDDLVEGRPAAAMCLCRRHADTLRPPRQWDVRDLRPADGHQSGTAEASERSDVAEGFGAAVGADVVSLDSPVSPVIADSSPSWSPRLFTAIDGDPLLDVRSPLLSRAFRGI